MPRKQQREALSGSEEEKDDLSHYLLNSYRRLCARTASCLLRSDSAMTSWADHACFTDEETKAQSNLLKVNMAELGFSLEPKTPFITTKCCRLEPLVKQTGETP